MSAVPQSRIQFVYDFATLDSVPDAPTSVKVAARRLLSGPSLATGKSSTVGAVLSGSHIICTLGTQARGSGARPHTHPNEQFAFVVEGGLEANLAGQTLQVGERCLLHVPPGMPHALTTPHGALVVIAQDNRHAFAA